jgi:transposase
MSERRRKYTPEFKDEAAKMVVETSRPIAEAARGIHVNPGMLGNCGCAMNVEGNSVCS